MPQLATPEAIAGVVRAGGALLRMGKQGLEGVVVR